MGAGSVLAGFIVLLLGVAGLLSVFGYVILPLDLASISLLFTRDGAIVLYGAMAVIGIGVMADVGPSESPREREGTLTISEVQRLGLTKPQVVVVAQTAQPALGRSVTVIEPELATLDLTILRGLSRRESRKEIARDTGLSEKVVSERVDKLRSEGYIDAGDMPTEKGYEAIRLTGYQVLPSNPGS
jgi:Winged helix-turn-helix DNA-binding